MVTKNWKKWVTTALSIYLRVNLLFIVEVNNAIIMISISWIIVPFITVFYDWMQNMLLIDVPADI